MKYVAAVVALLTLAPIACIGLVFADYRASVGPPAACTTATTSTTAPLGSAGQLPSSTGDPSCTSPPSLRSAPPFTGPDSLVPDPTTRGRITRRMLHVYNQVQATFHPWPWPVSCWDPHLWNPTSDHPKGRACDFTVGRIGHRPDPAQAAIGWQLAHWAQANTAALGISYIIYAGHIWNPTYAAQGWRPYNGAGIYNHASTTGGHYDHVHISVL